MRAWILSTALTLSATGATAAESPDLAVLDIAGNGIDEMLLPTLTEMLTAEIDGLGMYQVIAGRDVEAMLGFESERLTMGCDDASCLAEIGGALGVERMVKPQIGRVGALYVVNIKVINIKLAKTEGRVYETVSGGDEELLATISRSVKRLLGPNSRTGRLVLAAKKGAAAAAAGGKQTGSKPTSTTASASDSGATSATATAAPADASGGARASSGDSEGDSGDVAAASSSPPSVEKQGKSSGVPILPIVVGGVGVAVVGIGFAFGAMAKDAESCANAIGGCVGSQNAIATAQSNSLLANVMFISGGVVAAAAVVLFLVTGGDDNESAALAPLVGAGMVGVAYGGRF